jgi:hypothetical protein
VPDEGLGVFVPGCDPSVEIRAERGDGSVRGALQQLAGELGEPAFDQVELGARRGCEMELEPRVAQEPGVDGRGLVGARVVQHDVDVQAVGHHCVDGVE